MHEPAITRGPVYPLFLCGVYKVFGSRAAMASINTWHVNWDRVRIVQCVLHAVTGLFVFCIVWLIWVESFWPALTAALIHAFCFYNVFYTRALLSESVTTFILSGFILLSVLALKTNKALWWLVAGMSFGVTVLSRPEYMPFAFVFGGYILWAYRDRGRIGIRNVILFAVAAVCTVTPWTIRNYRVSQHKVLISGSGVGYGLYFGTFESKENWKGWGDLPDQVFYLPRERERFNTLYAWYFENASWGNLKVLEADAAFMQLALERIKTRPLECLGNWLTKAPRLWHQNRIPIYQEEEASGNWFVFYFVFACLAFGLSTKEERVLLGLVGLLFVYLNLIFLPMHVEPRYGVALMPGMIALTGIGLGKTCMWIRAKLIN